MRDYLFIDKYLDELQQDVYSQPDDEGHTRMAAEIIDKWMPKLNDVHTVLDVGCGTGFCWSIFHKFDVAWLGIAIDTFSKRPPIVQKDFTFTGWQENFCDLIFSRHSLEHSPFPLLTLMEWHRLSKKYLMLIIPNPGYYTYIGRNHYSVMNIRQIRWLLRRSGWQIQERDYSEPTELRYLCTKRTRVGYEGYVSRLTAQVYEADRDDGTKDMKE